MSDLGYRPPFRVLKKGVMQVMKHRRAMRKCLPGKTLAGSHKVGLDPGTAGERQLLYVKGWF